MIVWLRQRRLDGLILLALALLPLILYGRVTLGSQTMIPADNLYQWAPWSAYADEMGIGTPHNSLISDLLIQNYPWRRFIRNSLGNGELPLWNPYLFAGAPFLATGQNAAYYPFSIFFLILPLTKAYGWYIFSQLWLAGALMYVLGRVLGLRRGSAALAGLVYQGCGFMLVSAAVFPMIIGAAVWLPLILASTHKVLRHTGRSATGSPFPWFVLGTVALGFQVLAGHIEITYYTLLILAAYAGWHWLGRLLEWWRATRQPPAPQQKEAGAAASRTGEGAGRRRRSLAPLWRPVAWLSAMIIIGWLLLGAIQFIPFLEVGTTNFREGAASFAEVRRYGFPYRRLITLILPDFFGNPAHHAYRDFFTGAITPFTVNAAGAPNPHGAGTSNWGIKNYVEGGIYLGILPLVLAVLGVWYTLVRPAGTRLARSEAGFLTVLSLFSVGFIFGTPLYALLYYGLPFINQLHSPFRWVFPLSLAVALLAGAGLDAIRRAPKRAPIRLLTGIAAAGGVALWGGLLLARVAYDAVAPLVERVFLGLAQAPDAFPSATAFFSYQARNGVILGGMLLGTALVLWLAGRLPAARRRWLPLLACVLVAADLGLIGYGFNAAVDPALLSFKPEMVTWLEENLGQHRFTTFDGKGDKPFNANVGWLYDLRDVRGYDSIISRQYVAYMNAIEPQNELAFNRIQPLADWQSINSPLLDLLGVKYIITHETLDLPKLRLAWAGEGIRVYENLAVMPRAYTQPLTAAQPVPAPLTAMQTEDPRRTVLIQTEEWPADLSPPAAARPADPVPASILASSNIEVTVAATVAEPSWLVLTDSYFPGWKVFVRPAGAPEDDEEQIALVRANGNFRAVPLAPGAWEVRFRYSPVSFQLGGLVSVMGGIIILFATLVWLWRRFYDPDVEMTNTRSIAKNSLAPMVLNLFNRGIDFVFAMFYLRLLGPADAGAYATAIAIAGFYEILSNFGLNTLLIREVSLDKGEASRYLLNTTILRLGTGVVASLPIAVYVLGRAGAGEPLNEPTVAAIAMLMVGMVFSGMGQGLAGLFYAYEIAERPAAITTITTIFKVALGVVALLLGFGFVGLAAVSIVVNVITLIILTGAALRQFDLPGPWQVDFGLQRWMVRRSYPLMLNHLLAVIFFQVDVPLLQQINGDAVVGWYNSAYKWVNAFNVIPSFFTFALFPIISRQVHSSLSDARRTFRMSAKLLVLVAIPLAAVTTFMAPFLIGVLGGAEFLPAGAITLQLVIWSIPFGWLNSVTNYMLIALGLERIETRAFVIAVAFNIITNLIFLPAFSYVAAAITTIFSEIVLLLIFNYYLRTRLDDVNWLGLLARPALVGALMLLAMAMVAPLHWSVSVLVGLLVYAVGLWRLRVLGAEEKRILQTVLPASLVARLPGLAPVAE